MPTRNPEAVRQRAVAAARQRSRQLVTPPLDPVFVALNPGALPARPRTPAELHQWVRRDEEYATLGANVAPHIIHATLASRRYLESSGSERRAADYFPRGTVRRYASVGDAGYWWQAQR